MGRQCCRQAGKRELSDDGSAVYRPSYRMHGRAIHGVVVGQVGPEGALSAHVLFWAGLGACFKYIFDSDKVYACI